MERNISPGKIAGIMTAIESGNRLRKNNPMFNVKSNRLFEIDCPAFNYK